MLYDRAHAAASAEMSRAPTGRHHARKVAFAVILLILPGACRRDPPTLKSDPDEKSRQTTVVIRKRVPAIGARAHQKNSAFIAMNFTEPAGLTQDGGFEQRNSDDRTEEVLAVHGSIITKVRVAYSKRTAVHNRAGFPPATPVPVEGRSYIVRQTGTGIEVTVEGAGLILSSAEQAIVEGDFAWLGEEDELSRALPDAPIHLGDSVVPVARALKQRFFGAPDTVIEAADAHVEKISADHVVFRVQATLVRTQESIFRNTIVGTITVRTSDGWISAWALDVAHSISTGDAAVRLEGTGKTSISGSRSYF